MIAVNTHSAVRQWKSTAGDDEALSLRETDIVRRGPLL